MYAETSFVLAVMVFTFALASWKLKSPELSMVITAVVGALAGGLGFPVRLLVEGTFTYFDVAFTFLTASIFINWGCGCFFGLLCGQIQAPSVFQRTLRTQRYLYSLFIVPVQIII